LFLIKEAKGLVRSEDEDDPLEIRVNSGCHRRVVFVFGYSIQMVELS
jgi:hypothetical protein